MAREKGKKCGRGLMYAAMKEHPTWQLISDETVPNETRIYVHDIKNIRNCNKYYSSYSVSNQFPFNEVVDIRDLTGILPASTFRGNASKRASCFQTQVPIHQGAGILIERMLP
jgi:hypothetical protein